MPFVRHSQLGMYALMKEQKGGQLCPDVDAADVVTSESFFLIV